MTYKFKGVCPVINVPFDENENIDYEGLKNVIEYTIKQGVQSMCVFAFNSEPHKMSTDEKKQVIQFFLETVNGRVETLIGLIENAIGGVIELGKCAEKYHADGVILYPPALSTPSGAELLNYFKTIADNVNLDIMIQDNPRSTGVNMSLEFLIEAFNSIERFNYLKVECPIPMRKMKQIIKLTDGKLKCYSGNGGIFAVEAFLNGAWGIMPGAVMAGQCVELYDKLSDGKIDEGRAIFEKFLPMTWYEDQSLEFYVSCEKYLLKEFGVIKSDTCRRPNCAMTEDEKKELLALYERTK